MFWIVRLGYATDQNTITEARSAGVGFASVSLPSFDNPAGISLLRDNFAALHYDNLYGLKELSQVAAVVAVRNRWLDVGAMISNFGYEKYSESRIVTQFSKNLDEGSSVGVRLNYYSFLLAVEEGRKSAVSADVGLLLNPIEKLQIGIDVENIVGTSYTTSRDKYALPLMLRVGANYAVAKDLLVLAEVGKCVELPVRFKLGCEYLPIKEAALRIGFIGRPYQPTFGVGYRVSHFAFDVASVYHVVLGFHHLFSMQYKF